MNHTALLDLVSRWITFSEAHPKGSVDEFAGWLLSQKEKKENPPSVTAEQRGFIGFQMGVLFRFVTIWEKKAFADLPLRGFSEFGVLASVMEAGFPRKSDVINELKLEPSTGFELIKKMVREGFISEVTDSDDLRSVRLKMSPIGRRVFQEVSARVEELTALLLGDLSDESLLQLQQFLLQLNGFHNNMYANHRHADWQTISGATRRNG